MNPLERVSLRLSEQDLLQLLLAYLALLFFVLLLTWPQTAGTANNSWRALAQARLIALLVLSIAQGSALHHHRNATQLDTLFALGLFFLIGMPFEFAGYAASFPTTPPWWPLLMTPLNIVGFFGVGTLIGKLFAHARLNVLIPLIAPLLLGGMVALDITLARPELNPLRTAHEVSSVHLAIVAGLSVLTLFQLRPRRTPPQGSA